MPQRSIVGAHVVASTALVCCAARSQQLSTQRQTGSPKAIRQEAEVTDADKAFGQHVKKEAAQKLGCCQCHLALLAAMGIILPAKSDAADVRDLLAQSMVELRAGELDPRVAASLCSLVAEFLKTQELCTLEDVIEPLERERVQARGVEHAVNGNKESSAKTN